MDERTVKEILTSIETNTKANSKRLGELREDIKTLYSKIDSLSGDVIKNKLSLQFLNEKCNVHFMNKAIHQSVPEMLLRSATIISLALVTSLSFLGYLW